MNTIDDVATRLKGSKVFTTLDANMGYYQLKLTEESSFLTTFNTPNGRYRYLRMPMGISCAAEYFQSEMINVFGHIEGVEVVSDDILIHGKDTEEHNKRLIQVLEVARKHNIKLNKAKCKFGKTEVDYVGHKLTGDGLMPTDERVRAIREMRDPECHKELETVLGMLAYVAKFVPRLSEISSPLRALKKEEEWHWGSIEKETLEKIKQILTTEPVLKYYNTRKPVTLSVDASMQGLGAAVIQGDGTVAYASRVLTPAETRYAQIEKEMLAVVFGFTRFHKLLYAKEDITVESDHQPLESILKKPMHSTPMRIQKMRLKLQPYNFKLVYKKGKDIGLADCLSRFPQQGTAEPLMDDELMVCLVETLAYSNHKRIQDTTQEDDELLAVTRFILQGWPGRRADAGKAAAYFDVRDELCTYDGIVFKGDRVCIPQGMRQEMLKAIHQPHLGVVMSKRRARDLLYWPTMNGQIEDVVSKCSTCLQYRNKPQREPMIIHELPNLAWSKVGTDLFEIDGSYFMVLVDYFSNYIDVTPLSNQKSRTVIKSIKAVIARFGIMDTLMSDNGPAYSSEEFETFTREYVIHHVTSSPTHPQSNGLAEKAVQTAKRLIKKCSQTGGDIYLALLDLNSTQRDEEIGSPMQRMLGRRVKTRLPTSEALLKPSQVNGEGVKEKLMEYRMIEKKYYDRGTKMKEGINNNTGNGIRILTDKGYQPAEFIREANTPRSYLVKAGDQARQYRRNRNKLLVTREAPHLITPRPPPYVPMNRGPMQHPRRVRPAIPPDPTGQPNEQQVIQPPQQPVENAGTSSFGRQLRRPKHLDDYV